jgi:hypothetical protein
MGGLGGRLAAIGCVLQMACSYWCNSQRDNDSEKEWSGGERAVGCMSVFWKGLTEAAGNL